LGQKIFSKFACRNSQKILHTHIEDLEYLPICVTEGKHTMPVKKRKKAAKAKPRKKAKRSSKLMQMQYGLSAELAEIVGSKKATRPMVVKKIWAYIKAKKLQDSKNRRMINPDKKLGEVLGNRSIDMLKMAGALNKHIKKA
jgi:chromatin remodeling complex protein RSC6